MVNASFLLSCSLSQSHEDGIACIHGMYIMYKDAIYHRSIHTLDGNGGTKGILHTNIAYLYIPEASPRCRTKLDRTGTTDNIAVIYLDISVGRSCMVRFEADAIVGRIDVATRYAHMLAIRNIDSIIVPISTIMHFQSHQSHMRT